MIGLGNPGEEYKKQRHNAGFMFLDWLSGEIGLKWSFEKRFNSQVTQCSLEGMKVLLIKPQTFMNNSGEAVEKLCRFYKLSPSDIYLIHDDVDLALGDFRFVFSRGSAGHHGVESVQESLGTADFYRGRLGIGRGEGEQKVESYVLEDFSPEELTKLISIYPHVRETVFLNLKT